MGSASRIALLFLLMLAPVGLASCGERNSPTAPTPGPPTPGPLTPGLYRLILLSLGESHGCSGGSTPGFGQSGAATIDVQLQAEGLEWVARPRTPERGDFQLTLRIRDGERLVTGTMRGRALDDSSPGSRQGAVDVSQSTTVDGSVSVTPSVAVWGRASGELVYDQSFARVTCTSAIWTLARG